MLCKFSKFFFNAVFFLFVHSALWYPLTYKVYIYIYILTYTSRAETQVLNYHLLHFQKVLYITNKKVNGAYQQVQIVFSRLTLLYTNIYKNIQTNSYF